MMVGAYMDSPRALHARAQVGLYIPLPFSDRAIGRKPTAKQHARWKRKLQRLQRKPKRKPFLGIRTPFGRRARIRRTKTRLGSWDWDPVTGRPR